MAERYEFLSPEWIDAAKRVRAGYDEPDVPPGGSMRMNVVVTETPFDAGDVKAHVDTSAGQLMVEHGHLETPDLTVTVDYVTAKALFVEQDLSAAMQAFMAGRVKVQGDITKLMTLQAGAMEHEQRAIEIATAIRDITAD